MTRTLNQGNQSTQTQMVKFNPPVQKTDSELHTHIHVFKDGSTTLTNQAVDKDGVVRLIHVSNNNYDDGLASTNDPRAKPQVSDSHFHPTNYVQQGLPYPKMIEHMGEIGVYRSTIMPIPTDVMPCGDHGNHNTIEQRSYYIPSEHASLSLGELTGEKENEIVAKTNVSLNQQVDADTALFLSFQKLSMAQRDRLDPMITGLHLGSGLATQSLLFKLAKDPGVFTGIGEVTIHKELIEGQFEGSRQANLTDNVQAFKNIAEVAGIIGMPIVLHCDVDSTENQRQQNPEAPVHLEDIKKLFLSPETKDTTIIWAHAGGLGRFVKEPEGHINSLREILNDPGMKNVHLDISWSRVIDQITKDEKSVNQWAKLLNDFPNRFLFGSDCLNPEKSENWGDTVKLYEKLFEKIESSNIEKIRNGNYERVIKGARENVRKFEKLVLTSDYVTNQVRATGDGRNDKNPILSPAKLREHRDAVYAKEQRPYAPRNGTLENSTIIKAKL